MSTRVQVATTIFNEPIPGVLVTTDMGDVIYVFDRATGTMGFHAPGKMKMKYIVTILDNVYKEYVEKQIDPFVADDTVPLVVEEDFIFANMNG